MEGCHRLTQDEIEALADAIRQCLAAGPDAFTANIRARKRELSWSAFAEAILKNLVFGEK